MGGSSDPRQDKVSPADLRWTIGRGGVITTGGGYLARMRIKPLLSLVAALVLMVALPACGEDEPTTGGTTQEQATPQDGTATEPSDQDLEAAIDACKQSVENAPQLSDTAKRDIQSICEEGDPSDAEQVKENAGKVCQRIVEESVPEGAARDQAVETCKTATE
jgi:hypothetical protein